MMTGTAAVRRAGSKALEVAECGKLDLRSKVSGAVGEDSPGRVEKTMLVSLTCF